MQNEAATQPEVAPAIEIASGDNGGLTHQVAQEEVDDITIDLDELASYEIGRAHV